MIQATTNQKVGLNVITELIIGYALPGRPVAMMLFKVGLLGIECVDSRLPSSVR